MQTSRRSFFITIFVVLGMIHPMYAEPIQVKVRVADEAGEPISGLDLRLVVGSEKNPRSPDAGKKLRTAADGSVLLNVNTPIKERKIKLDSAFARTIRNSSRSVWRWSSWGCAPCIGSKSTW